MGPDQPENEGSLAEVASLLGVADPASLAGLGLDSLRKRTQRQLLEASRRLGLAGVSKLTKDALAQRLWQALISREQDELRPIVEEAGRKVLTHKFELGEPAGAPAEEPRTIPWSYGMDRLTVMAVDPDRVYCYWELTDDAIARARRELGGGGPGAWLNLRVYDTTGRIFDGTNAHGYFDHKIERHERQWFFQLGKPSSEHFVEVGLLSHEGFFAKIARSGRVDSPRREPVGWVDPEWMTVHVSGETQAAGRGLPGGGGATGGGEAARFEPVPLWHMRAGHEDVVRLSEGGYEQRIEWEEVWRDGFTEGVRRFTWESPHMVSSWESGPFTYPVEVPEPTSESFEGPLQVFRVQNRTHVVYGPWQVVIRGLGAHYNREVLSRWEVYRTWVAEEGHEVRGVRTTRAPGVPGGASEQLLVGASERRWRGESELRLRGASEVFYVGASERRFLGASETAFAAASERRLRGASEQRFAGASELRFRGGSEQRLGGASELLGRGGSERRLGGGSDERLGGGSEERLAETENPYPPVPNGHHG